MPLMLSVCIISSSLTFVFKCLLGCIMIIAVCVNNEGDLM